MQKVIKIKDVSFEVFNDGVKGATCHKCFFGNDDKSIVEGCPRSSYTDNELLCVEFDNRAGGSDESHYFVKVEDKSLVEDFKEAAGIQAEKTYTRQQVWDAYLDWTGDSDTSTRFCDHIEKYSDPEYQEYLRLSKKFGN